MSKILLIKPRLFDDFWFQESITQPMGLIYISAKLKKAGHETKIHDCGSDYKDLNRLKNTIKNWKPDFIGISIIITELEQTKNIMTIIREIMPDVPVTFGGPWPSANPEESIDTFGADFVVIGEGELVFPELIDTNNKKLPIDSIAGIAFSVNGNVKINPGRYLTEDELNVLPFPVWELLDHSLYAKMRSMPGVGCRPYMSIVTSRGCPYRCAYCHQTMGKVFRKRSAESVLAEMEELRFKHGFKEFEILDDCFNLDRKRMYAILTGIRDRIGDARLHFPNALRSDMLEPEDMPLFKQAGTVSAHFAIETSSPRLQKMIHKNLNIEKASRAINASVKAGIYSTGYFMIGFPTETYEEACKTVEYAKNSSLHRALFFNPKPFAGTEMAEMAANSLKNKNDSYDPQKMNYCKGTINISAMSDNEMQMVFQNVYKRFYLNPKRILRMMILVMRHPEVFSIKRIAGMFFYTFLTKRQKN
jgi:anaerobic magnesium-protoporphyrin IX monomethyl ester cyclase